MMRFLQWFGRPKGKTTLEQVLEELDPTHTEQPIESTLVAKVLLRFLDGKRELRGVYQVGEQCFLWTHDLADTAKLVLPNGDLGDDGPSFVTGWEPVSPADWQPNGAESSHEAIARLRIENSVMRERLASHERLLSGIAMSAKSAVG